MSKKKKQKTNNPTETNAVPKKTASQLKKEQKAEAARQEKERYKKRQRYYGIAAIVAFISVVVSFASGSVDESTFGWMQVLCYSLMGSCGILMMCASRYEDFEKKQKRMHLMGIVFLMMGFGLAAAQIVVIMNG